MMYRMKHQANRDYISNDLIMTPEPLAERIIEYFHPSGIVLEPCRGSGSFYKFVPSGSLWCEITEGRDFMQFRQKVDWIITNPPWSKIRQFFQRSMLVSDNVVFLMTINHLWTKARIRDIYNNYFGVAEIIMIDTPDNFPPLGFQVGVVYLKGGYEGGIKLTDWRTS